MSIDTKGFLFGGNRKSFSLEKLVGYLNKNYTGIMIDNIQHSGYCSLYFNDHKDKRGLSLFTNYSYFKSEKDYPEINDNEIILFSLGCWGNSLDIIKGILGYFGGGYIQENDCIGDWYIIPPCDTNKNTSEDVSDIIKIMTHLNVDEKVANRLYKTYLEVEGILV